MLYTLRQQLFLSPDHRPIFTNRAFRGLKNLTKRARLHRKGARIHRTNMEPAQPRRMQIVKILVKTLGNRQQLQATKALRH